MTPSILDGCPSARSRWPFGFARESSDGGDSRNESRDDSPVHSGLLAGLRGLEEEPGRPGCTSAPASRPRVLPSDPRKNALVKAGTE